MRALNEPDSPPGEAILRPLAATPLQNDAKVFFSSRKVSVRALQTRFRDDLVSDYAANRFPLIFPFPYASSQLRREVLLLEPKRLGLSSRSAGFSEPLYNLETPAHC